MAAVLDTHAALSGAPRKMAIIVLLGCTGWLTSCGNPQEEELDAFVRIRGEEQRIAEFKKKPCCAQIDLYLYAMTTKPPRQAMAAYIAHSGEAILPTLLNRLETEKQDRVQRDLTYALQKMAILHPTLKDNVGVVRIIRQEIDGMGEPYQTESKELLKAILAERQK